MAADTVGHWKKNRTYSLYRGGGVRKLVIAHRKPGLDKVNDQHAYLDEKRHALELWAGRLGSTVETAPANVVPLRA